MRQEANPPECQTPRQTPERLCHPPEAHNAKRHQEAGTTHIDWERYHELEALGRSGHSEAALSGFRELLASAKASDERSAILLAMVSCLRELGRNREAKDAVSEIYQITDEKSTLRPWTLLCDARLRMDDDEWKAALEKFDEVLSTFAELMRVPENEDILADVQRMRGIALYRLHRAKEALPLLERAAARDVERATVLYYLGRCCYDLGALEKAQASLREAMALDLDPLFQPGAHYVLGLSYRWRGQNARAAEEYRWCLENDAKGLVPKRSVLTALVDASKALGMEDEVARYSAMLRDV